MDEAPRLYLVARIGWRVRPTPHNHTYFGRDFIDTSAPEDRRFIPVATFRDRTAAEARMRELEREAAHAFNPFYIVGPLDELTSFSQAQLISQLGALVGPLPAARVNEDSSNRKPWQVWWDEHMPTWSDETLAAVWELFDAIRFYAVIEVDAD